MSDEQQNRTAEKTLLAIAWAQFLTAAAVMDKRDMRDLHTAWEEIVKSVFPIKWDWTKFGAVAVALNIIAICFLSVAVVNSLPSEKKTKEEGQEAQKVSDLLGGIGSGFWMFSFYVFVGYLNRAFLLCVLIASVVCFYFLGFYSSRRKAS